MKNEQLIYLLFGFCYNALKGGVLNERKFIDRQINRFCRKNSKTATSFNKG